MGSCYRNISLPIIVILDVKLCPWVKVKQFYFSLEVKALGSFGTSELPAQWHSVTTPWLESSASQISHFFCASPQYQPSSKTFRLLVTWGGGGCYFGFQCQLRYMLNILQLFDWDIHCNSVFGMTRYGGGSRQLCCAGVVERGGLSAPPSMYSPSW
jgi:hypothetical protein